MFKADASLGTEHPVQISIPPLRLQHLRQHLPCTWTVQISLHLVGNPIGKFVKSLSFFHLMYVLIQRGAHLPERCQTLDIRASLTHLLVKAPLVQSQQVTKKALKMFARLFWRILAQVCTHQILSGVDKWLHIEQIPEVWSHEQDLKRMCMVHLEEKSTLWESRIKQKPKH